MKRIILLVAILALVLSGAFAQFTFGISAQSYYIQQDDGSLPTIAQAWKDFQDGESVFWGGFVELIIDKLGLGVSFNQQTYVNDDPNFDLEDMWNYDANIYASYHLFGGKAFIDPFAQLGFGQWGFGFVDADDPMLASYYVDYGLGLGINLGPVGAFFKAMWNTSLPKEKVEDSSGNQIDELPVMPFKWVFGAKLLL